MSNVAASVSAAGGHAHGRVRSRHLPPLPTCHMGVDVDGAPGIEAHRSNLEVRRLDGEKFAPPLTPPAGDDHHPQLTSEGDRQLTVLVPAHKGGTIPGSTVRPQILEMLDSLAAQTFF